MAVSVKEKESLPQFCPKGKHRWVRASVHGCGAVEGEADMQEVLVLATEVEQGAPGTVCNDCFIIYERYDGKKDPTEEDRDPTLKAVYLAALAWEEQED